MMGHRQTTVHGVNGDVSVAARLILNMRMLKEKGYQKRYWNVGYLGVCGRLRPVRITQRRSPESYF